MSSVVYLYGFVPSDTAKPPEELVGVDGSGIRTVEVGAFSAAVSDVDADAYGEAGIHARLDDLAWIGRQGAAHETVVTWFSDQNTIVPARLLTVFSSDDALRKEAESRRGSITDHLVRFRTLREWDLKVSVDHETLVANLGDLSETTAELDTRIEASSPGRRYLLERKKEETQRDEATAAADRLASDLLGTLGAAAEEVKSLTIPKAGDGLPVVLSAALLVDQERVGELRSLAKDAVDRLEARGLHVTLTGPWAPYRFMSAAIDE